MSEIMTCVHLLGLPSGRGFADYGRRSVPEMVAYIRRHAAEMKRDAEAILAADDEDFRVTTYRGILVQRDAKVLQQGKK